MTNQPFACENYEQDLSLLAAGCLSEEETQCLHEHVADCDACRAHLEQLTAMCERLTAARPSVSAINLQRLTKKVVAEISKTEPRRSVSASWLWIAGITVAASLVAVLLIQSLLRTRPDIPDQAERPLVPVAPPIEIPPSTSLASNPATWLDYQHALADSDEAMNRLLDKEADRLTFLSLDSSAQSLQELLP